MTEEEMRIKKYDTAILIRNFEIELFWKRSLFFWGFISSSFVGYATLSKTRPSLAILIACFGFVCSVAWSLVNRGSKYWQENWETIVAKIEDDVTGSLFKEREEQKNKGIWLSSRKFSVSKITIAMSDFSILVWLLLIGYHIIKITSISYHFASNCFTIIIVLFSLVFAFMMGNSGRSSDAKK